MSEENTAPSNPAPAGSEGPSESPSLRDTLATAYSKAEVAKDDDERANVERWRNENRRDELPKREMTGRDRAEQERLADGKSRRDGIEKHLAPYYEMKETAAGWEKTRELRETLRHRYPGASLGELFSTFEKYSEMLQGGPEKAVQAAEMLRRHYHGNPSFRFDGAFKSKEYGKDIRGSLDRVVGEIDDLKQLTPYMEKHGKEFDRLLQRIVQLDGALNEDVEGTVAKLLAMNGAPVTDQQVAESNAELERQQNLDTVTKGINTIIENGFIPGLEDEGIQNAVADVLEDKRFKWTGNGPQDLQRAVQLAKDRLAKERTAEIKAKANKAITGSPNAGSVSAGKGKATTTREALSNAMGNV
jgi:hypothetical protein